MIQQTTNDPKDDLPAPPASCRDGLCQPLLAYKQSLRRGGQFRRLPIDVRATCPACDKVVPARFDRLNSQIVLVFDCPSCTVEPVVHYDAIWTDLVGDWPGGATHTFSGCRIQPVLRGLPRTLMSLCPECSAIIPARNFVRSGAVWMEKTCPQHGYFRDCVNSDVLLYSKASWWSFQEHPGQQFPQVTGGRNCPSDCGLCNQHLSSPCLAQIDLTNRCNMRCPVCFANAGVTGRVYQPDYDEVVRQLGVLRELHPTPCTAIQFTGGEPTVHPDFLRIVAKARRMGFTHIQIATNGIKLADSSFAHSAAQAGLHTLYLQFDGVGEDAYTQTRAWPGIWAKKLQTIENCRREDMKICLVPTIIKGVNDHRVGEIFHFAAANADVISGISYQPVSFTGRIDSSDLEKRRYTLGDLAHDLGKASSASPLRDMYPLSIVVPLAQLLEALTGEPKIRPSCHPDCAFGTYFLISPDGLAYPFPQVVDIEGLFVEMNRLSADIRRRGRATWLDRLRAMRMFRRHFNARSAPPGLTAGRFVRTLHGMVDKSSGRGQAGKETYRTLLCAGMHFQDRYNFDVQRACRCVILYSTPAGVFPFCTYNCGPEYRPIVEACYTNAQIDQSRPADNPQPARRGGQKDNTR